MRWVLRGWRGSTLALILSAVVSGASAGEDGAIAVITNPGSTLQDFDQSQLKDVFLKRLTMGPSNNKVVPLNLPVEHALRQAFSRSLLGKEPSALQSYWNRRYYHSVSPPHILDSQEAMIRFVSATEGAVGYVAECRANKRVNIITVLKAAPELAEEVATTCPE